MAPKLTRNKTIILVAVGVVGLSSRGVHADERYIAYQDKSEHRDGEMVAEITVSLEQMESAEEGPDQDGWIVELEASDLSGFEVPDDVEYVRLQLTDDQYSQAVALAEAGTSGTTTFIVSSHDQFGEIQAQLLGGFDLDLVGSTCAYGCQNEQDTGY